MFMEPDVEPGEPFWDRNSFDDSDRFEESICTWSDQESICNNWRGWKNNVNTDNSNNNNNSTSNNKNKLCNLRGKIDSLVELAAHRIACTIPFGVVEKFDPPVPIDLQIRIAYWSFPEDEEDIRLYACLANGNAEEYQRAEILIKQKCVREMLQIGFHLSAAVSPTATNSDTHKVAITFDRQRIISCSCTCDSQVIWCHHIVAVCLNRIHNPQQALMRAPVSESLLRLNRDQLQKFAQYLINEFPQLILPTAQNLLDDLLTCEESLMNITPGAPDPTAGATASETTSWCLDKSQIHIDIRKILTKQRTNQSTVYSDVNHLNSTAPPAASEYSQLLRPLRGREPEGLYNFLSIVREMLRKRDHNSIPLLEIITEELLACEQIIVWWYETKVSLHSGLTNPSLKSTYSCTNQHACSSLCDEVVMLWRLAALDPDLSPDDKLVLQKKLSDWHLKILERQNNSIDSSRGVERPHKKIPEFFSGFKPGLEACLVDWTNWQDDLSFDAQTNRRPTKQEVHASESSHKSPSKATKKKAKSIKESCNEEPQPSTSTPGEKADDFSIYYYASKSDNLIKNVGKSTSEAKSDDPKDAIRLNMKKIKDPLENLFSKAEGLYAHGFTREASSLSVKLAQAILNQNKDNDEKTTLPNLNLDTYLLKSNKRSKKSYIMNQLSLKASDTLNKVAFLCAVLSENPEHHNLAFRIGFYGLELDRGPAYTKALEVKLINQEQDLVCLLKKIPLTSKELDILREKSEELCQGTYKSKCDALKPLMLAGYIFDAFVLSPSSQNRDNYNSSQQQPQRTATESSNREYASYRQHPPLRQASISSMSSIGEFSYCSSINPKAGSPLLVCDKLPSDKILGFEAAVAAIGYKMNISEAEHPLLCEGTRRLRGELALLLLVHYKDDKTKLDLIMDKLLDKDEPVDDVASNFENLKVNVKNESAPSAEPEPETSLNEQSAADGSTASSNSYNSTTSRRGRRKLNAANAPNQPSEASAHFMFELAKTVFVKAGGNNASADIFHPNIIGIPSLRCVHRSLHMSSLKIALYALGLHNRTSTNWMSRTYSSHVTWIIAQALDIGLEAIKFLRETWQGYLTPIEAADLGDRAGLQRDSEVQRIAAELALSYLDYSHALTLIEIKKALVRCQEQSPEMLEKACMAIENSKKVGEVSSDILFEVSRRWYSMYEETSAALSSNKIPQIHHAVTSSDSFNESQTRNDNRAYAKWNQQHSDGNNGQSSSSHSCNPNHQIAHHHGSHPPIENGQECVVYIDRLRPMLCPNGLHNANTVEARAPLINAPQTIRYCPSTVPQQPFHYYPTVYNLDPKMMPVNHNYYQNQLMDHHSAQSNSHPYNTQHYFPHILRPQQQTIHYRMALMQPNSYFYNTPGMTPPNPNYGYYPQYNSNIQHPHCTFTTRPPAQSHHYHRQSVPPLQLNEKQLGYLQSSFRVGIKAMELINSGQESRNKYQTNEKYKEDVKWLLGVSKLLGSSYMKEFISCAIKNITNPLVLADIVECINGSECNLNDNLKSAMMGLIQSCQQAFTPYVQYKIKHFQLTKSSTDSESVLKRARPIFEMTVDGMARYNELKKQIERPRKNFKQTGKQKQNTNCVFPHRIEA